MPDPTAAAELSREVRIRNPRTGETRTVGAAALPFFTNQGFELADEPAPTPETPGRHEAAEPPADTADPGASTPPSPDTTSKES